MRRKLLPFWDERKNKIKMIVLHSVAMSAPEAIECFSKYKVSSHYVIDKDGEIWQLVAESHRAWHAGVAKWRDVKADINSCSIGIELCSKDLGQSDFTKEQKISLINLVQKLIKKYKIRAENIVGHSDIAPMRKADPGKAFFWRELAKKGIGIWPNVEDADKINNDDIGSLLQMVGYDTTDINAAIYAFCRRFLPEKIEKYDDVWHVEEMIAQALEMVDNTILKDEKFEEILKATAYAYLMASKTPCKM